MPTFIAPVVAWATGLGVASAAVVGISYAITIIGTLALSSYQKSKAERVARSAFDAAQVDRLVNVATTVAPRELVLGRTRKGGHIFFRSSVGQYKELFIMCVAVASHEIDGIEQIYLNDQPVDINEVGQVTTAPYGRAATLSADKDVPFGSTTVTLDYDPLPGSVSASESPFGQVGGHELECTVDGRVVTVKTPLAGWTARVHYQYSGFNSFVDIRWHLGSPNQTADGAMTVQFPGVWTWEHRARGIAYLVCSFAYNDGALPSGIPTVTARIRGAKIYDLRTGLTQFSENPAVMMRHVLLHPQFGKRTSLSFYEEQRIVAAANACDTLIAYDGNNLVPLYRACGVFLFGAPARDLLDDLAQAMAGEWAYAAGELFLRAGVYQLPVMYLGQADLAVVQRSNDGAASQNSIKISPHLPRNDTFNTVAIRIWDQAANYMETPITPYRADALVAVDGAALSQEVTMPAVFFAPQAFHIAGIMLRDSRDPMVVTMPFKMKAYPLELFDGVRLDLPRFGFSNKEFRVMGRTFTPGIVWLTLKETTAAIFAYGAGFVPGGYSPNTNLPQPWDIDPPTILSVSSGEGELVVQSDGTILNGVRVTWAPITDRSILAGGAVELDVRVLPDGAWTRYSAPGDATELKFTGVADLAMILIRPRTSNSLTASDWGTQVLHQVIGKTEPPPNIENLTIAGSVLSWSLPRRVPDLAGFVFRFHYGSNVDWSSAAPLHTGLITASPWEPETRPGGVVTIMGKAQDTSGNQSQTTANIVMNLGDPPIANVIEQWDFRAQGWPVSSDRGPLAPGLYPQYSVANFYSFTRPTTATYWNGGVIQTAGTNVPRFEDGQLLVEPARSNRMLRSQEFDSGVWAKVSGLVVTPNTDQAPDGTLTMDTLTGVAATTTYAQQIVTSLAAASTYTLSVFMKAGTSTSSMLRVFDENITSQLCGAIIAWASGVPTISSLLGTWAVPPTLEATPMPGIYRFRGGVATGALTALALLIYPSAANTAASAKYWGASIEDGPNATSYIATSAAP